MFGVNSKLNINSKLFILQVVNHVMLCSIICWRDKLAIIIGRARLLLDTADVGVLYKCVVTVVNCTVM